MFLAYAQCINSKSKFIWWIYNFMIVCNFLFDPKLSIVRPKLFWFNFFYSSLISILDSLRCNSKGYSTWISLPKYSADFFTFAPFTSLCLHLKISLKILIFHLLYFLFSPLIIAVSPIMKLVLFDRSLKFASTSTMSFWCLHCWLFADFTHYSAPPIVDFEQINNGWIIY